MKKIICALSLAASFATMAASDDYLLYWEVGDSYINQYVSNANLAQLVAVLSDNSTANVSGAAFGSTSSELSAGPTSPANLNTLTLTSSQTLAGFYVEFFDWSGSSYSSIGKSDTISYANAYNNGYITDFTGSYQQKTATGTWSVTGFTAVPEPTSGLLMLLGLAGLALKRKAVA